MNHVQNHVRMRCGKVNDVRAWCADAATILAESKQCARLYAACTVCTGGSTKHATYHVQNAAPMWSWSKRKLQTFTAGIYIIVTDNALDMVQTQMGQLFS